MDMLIVTRHAGAVEWLRRRGIEGDVVAQVTAEQVRGRIVVGILPLHLAAEAQEVIALDMPGLKPEQRGKDLTPEEMDAAGATLTRYVVNRIATAVWPCLCCGTRKPQVRKLDGDWFVQCPECLFAGPGAASEQDAIAVWNQQQAAELAKLLA